VIYRVKYFQKKDRVDPRVLTANAFINIQDIAGTILYTKDNHLFSYIKLTPISVDLLSPTEKKLFINTLTAEISSETKPFQFFAISQAVDMSKLIENLHTIKDSVVNDNTRNKLIYNEISQITSFAINGDIIERQFFVIIWEKTSEEAELIIRRRSNDLAYKFSSCGVNAEILDTQRIYQLLKLFSHPYSADNNIKDDDFAPTIPTLGDI